MPSPNNRRWCFTVNNFKPSDEDLFQNLECTYIVYGRETGDSGTPHLQGYVTFKGTKTLSAMKKLHATAHWEMAKGSSLQASDYCKKEDIDFYERGNPPSPGKRNDLLELAEALKNGTDMTTVSNISPATYIRNYRGLANYAALQQTAYEHSGVRGIWLCGPPGTGKSHHARLFASALNGTYLKAQNKWWDGYAGEDVVILDDMDTDALAHYMKIWTDKYACTGEIKGGTVKLAHKWFIVTSNKTVADTFEQKGDSMVAAILRRCTEIYIGERTDSVTALTALV